jgi:hypothetical protein
MMNPIFTVVSVTPGLESAETPLPLAPLPAVLSSLEQPVASKAQALTAAIATAGLVHVRRPERLRIHSDIDVPPGGTRRVPPAGSGYKKRAQDRPRRDRTRPLFNLRYGVVPIPSIT